MSYKNVSEKESIRIASELLEYLSEIDNGSINNIIKSGDEEIRSCGKCNKTELGYDCEKTCIEEASVGYGAYVLLHDADSLHGDLKSGPEARRDHGYGLMNQIEITTKQK